MYTYVPNPRYPPGLDCSEHGALSEEHGPFLGPNPSGHNNRGSEARRSHSTVPTAQLAYCLTYKPLALRPCDEFGKAPQSSWVRAGSPRAGPLGTGPCTRRPLNTGNMHPGSPPFFPRNSSVSDNDTARPRSTSRACPGGPVSPQRPICGHCRGLVSQLVPMICTSPTRRSGCSSGHLRLAAGGAAAAGPSSLRT